MLEESSDVDDNSSEGNEGNSEVDSEGSEATKAQTEETRKRKHHSVTPDAPPSRQVSSQSNFSTTGEKEQQSREKRERFTDLALFEFLNLVILTHSKQLGLQNQAFIIDMSSVFPHYHCRISRMADRTQPLTHQSQHTVRWLRDAVCQ